MASNYKEVFQKAGKSLPEKLELSKREIGISVLRKIVQRTPVKTGLARGNWNLSLGQPDPTRQRPAPLGQSPISRAVQVLSGKETISQIHITNSLAYIGLLENGRSNQAPGGMVAVTAAEVPRIAQGVTATVFNTFNK